MSAVSLQVDGLCKSFGGNQAVRDIGFEVGDNEIVGLIGPNGAGKTTCFNLITGFYTPDAGSVRFGGEDVTALKPYQMARKGIVRSFQKTNILKSLTVFENVLTGHYLEANGQAGRILSEQADNPAAGPARECDEVDKGGLAGTRRTREEME